MARSIRWNHPFSSFLIPGAMLTVIITLVLCAVPNDSLFICCFIALGLTCPLALVWRCARHRHARSVARLDLLDHLLASLQFTTALFAIWLPLTALIDIKTTPKLAHAPPKSALDAILEPLIIVTILGLVFLIPSGLLFLALRALRRWRKKAALQSALADAGIVSESTGAARPAHHGAQGAKPVRMALANGEIRHLLRADIEHGEELDRALDVAFGHGPGSAPMGQLRSALEETLAWMSEAKLARVMAAWKRSPRRDELLTTLANESKIHLHGAWASELLIVAHQRDLPGAQMAALTALSQLSDECELALDYLDKHGTPTILPTLREIIEEDLPRPDLQERARRTTGIITRRQQAREGASAPRQHQDMSSAIRERQALQHLKRSALFMGVMTIATAMLLQSEPTSEKLEAIPIMLGVSYAIAFGLAVLGAFFSGARIDLWGRWLRATRYIVCQAAAWAPFYLILLSSHHGARGTPHASGPNLPLQTGPAIVQWLAILLAFELLAALLFLATHKLLARHAQREEDPFTGLSPNQVNAMLDQPRYLAHSHQGLSRLAESGLAGAPYLLQKKHGDVVQVHVLLQDLLLGPGVTGRVPELEKLLRQVLPRMSIAQLQTLLKLWSKSPINKELLPILLEHRRLSTHKGFSKSLLAAAAQFDLPGGHVAAITELSQVTGAHTRALDYLERHGTPEAIPALMEHLDKWTFTSITQARVQEVIETIQRRHGVQAGALSLSLEQQDRRGALSAASGNDQA